MKNIEQVTLLKERMVIKSKSPIVIIKKITVLKRKSSRWSHRTNSTVKKEVKQTITRGVIKNVCQKNALTRVDQAWQGNNLTIMIVSASIL